MQVWRTTLVANDPDRNWFAVWNRGGLVEPAMYSLIDEQGNPVFLVRKRLRPSTWIDGNLCYAFSIPNIPPGRYLLTAIGNTVATINVVPWSVPDCPPVISNRTFVDESLEINQPGILYRNCVFKRTSVYASNGLFLNCEWQGLATPGIGETHAFSTWGANGPLAIIGGLFDGTDRGPVLNLMTGSNITEPLFLGLTLRGISHIDGGNELLCVEARRRPDGELMFPTATVMRPIVSGWRCYNNEGDVYIAAPTENMLMQDVVIDRGSIVAFKDSLSGGMICGSELRNGRIVLADGDKVRVRRCALLDRRPTRGNRTYTERFFYEPKLNEKAAAIYNLPDGLTANGEFANGVSVQECHFREHP